ncbi:MAG: DUF6765 family protein [Clostridiales bacterium]
MQIDFHFGVTYILSRLAGFTLKESKIIAHSAQYVDDATNGKTIYFDNGEIFKPLSSAHRALDYRNFDNLSDHFVWIPFHFLPGNSMKKFGEITNCNFYERIKCKPDSYLAKDMIDEVVNQKNNENSLHRLGITMHVYADTWAHQEFSGIQHFSNRVIYLEDDEVSKNLVSKLSNFFKDVFDKKISEFIDDVFPIGHGAVLTYPDKPYLKWRYKDYSGKLIERDNPKIFLEAAKNMYKVLKQFRLGDRKAKVDELNVKDSKKLLSIFEKVTDSNPDERLDKLLKEIEKGNFSFGSEKVSYEYKGKGSWRYDALNGLKSKNGKYYKYSERFIKSDWKKVHDALYEHRHFVLRKIIPKYDLLIV